MQLFVKTSVELPYALTGERSFAASKDGRVLALLSNEFVYLVDAFSFQVMKAFSFGSSTSMKHMDFVIFSRREPETLFVTGIRDSSIHELSLTGNMLRKIRRDPDNFMLDMVCVGDTVLCLEYHFDTKYLVGYNAEKVWEEPISDIMFCLKSSKTPSTFLTILNKTVNRIACDPETSTHSLAYVSHAAVEDLEELDDGDIAVAYSQGALEIFSQSGSLAQRLEFGQPFSPYNLMFSNSRLFLRQKDKCVVFCQHWHLSSRRNWIMCCI